MDWLMVYPHAFHALANGGSRGDPGCSFHGFHVLSNFLCPLVHQHVTQQRVPSGGKWSSRTPQSGSMLEDGSVAHFCLELRLFDRHPTTSAWVLPNSRKNGAEAGESKIRPDRWPLIQSHSQERSHQKFRLHGP